MMNNVDIGRGAIVRSAIIDKNVRVPPGIKIGVDLQVDRERGYTLSHNGIVVIGKGSVLDPETGALQD